MMGAQRASLGPGGPGRVLLGSGPGVQRVFGQRGLAPESFLHALEHPTPFPLSQSPSLGLQP